jgi:hypothetical protein
MHAEPYRLFASRDSRTEDRDTLHELSAARYRMLASKTHKFMETHALTMNIVYVNN